MKNAEEIKIVCIGESGSGKSSMLTSFANHPEIYQIVIANAMNIKEQRQGTTEATVE